jgi:hypothetical protein
MDFAKRKGSYYGYKNQNDVNFYTCRIKKMSSSLSQVNFLNIIFSNGKEDTGSFNDYLNFGYYYKGTEKYITDGILKNINNLLAGVWQDCEFYSKFTFISQEILSLIENNLFRSSQPRQAPER